MSDSAKTWAAWKLDFMHGRTHVAYALIIGSVFSAIQTVIAYTIEQRIYAVVMLIASVGGLVDTVAHLYYH